ncbi:MAG: hypothetical protein FWC79_08220 [Oscillospiraceae bacterium]|nr:hypothetical protein [Oscillospiraceae bacterium]
MWGDIAIAFLLAFITAYVIAPYTIRFARKIGALDIPKSNRKIHTDAMPRLGGLAVISGFAVSVTYLVIMMSIEGSLTLVDYYNHHFQLLGFFVGALVLSIFAFIDDKRGLPPLVKLLGQILAAVCATLGGIRIDEILAFYIDGTVLNGFLSFAITIVWIVRNN